MKQILNVETNEPIPYSFKKVTYRKFRKAIDLMDESRTAGRDKRDALVEEAAGMLIEGASAIMDGATNSDVQQVLTDAIEFNQTTEADAKKSELPH